MISSTQKEFRCKHCDGKIMIPFDLPPTTGPCPHCAGVITSPGNEIPVAPPVVTRIPPPTPIPVPLQAVAIATPVVAPQAPVSIPPPSPLAQPVVLAPPAAVKVVEPPKEKLPAPEPIRESLPVKAELPSQKESRKSKEEEKQDDAAVSAKPQRSGLVLAMLALFFLFLAGLGMVMYVMKSGETVQAPISKPAAVDTAAKEMAYIKAGWKKDAYEILGNYVAAKDSKGKLPFVFNAPALATKIEDFYGGGVIIDSDTPAEAFSVYELSEEDRKRGLFMMIYDQPPQFDMREFFRPLASLEVQYGVDEADLLLSTLARVGNFAMEPLRVHAFFKRTSEGLKLDWEIFVQTKYRTFQNFTELPEIGQKAVFRVFIVEDVPDKGKAVTGTRSYRIADPANTTDAARTNVKIDSEIGRALSIINWRGAKDNKPITRTATVELSWVGEEAAPELEISRFVCWEFLGLGGQETPVTASKK